MTVIMTVFHVWEGRGNIKHIKWKVGRHLKIQIKFLGMKITMCKMDEINELGFPKLCDVAIETFQSEIESRKWLQKTKQK